MNEQVHALLLEELAAARRRVTMISELLRHFADPG